MKSILSVLLILISVGLCAISGSQVFFVNLFPKSVDVRLGDEGSDVFTSTGISEFSATVLHTTYFYGNYHLYYKLASSSTWTEWSSGGSPYECAVQEGKVHCIMVKSTGQMEYFTMNPGTGDGARIAFMNCTNESIPYMEVAIEFGDNDVAYAADLSEDTISNFAVATPGIYGMYWQTHEDVENEEYTYVKDSDGSTMMYSFQDGHWYVFARYQKNGDDVPELFDITP